MSRPLARSSKRTLRSLANRLERLSGDWADLDEYFRSQIDEAASLMRSISAEIEETYPGRSKRQEGVA